MLGEPQWTNRGAMILFPGREGNGHFSETQEGFSLSDNFLVRSSHLFTLEGYTVAIVDVPSDYFMGMPNSFRTSPEHARDIGEAVSFIADQGYEQVFLVGTSRGTLSVAYLATVLKNDQGHCSYGELRRDRGPFLGNYFLPCPLRSSPR